MLIYFLIHYQDPKINLYNTSISNSLGVGVKLHLCDGELINELCNEDDSLSTFFNSVLLNQLNKSDNAFCDEY